MRTEVMEGTLDDFDLSSVLQAVSIGRQHTGVELFDETGNVVGTVVLKSGKILAANTGSLSGIDAVTTLLRARGRQRFAVYRTEPSTDTRSPVGSVGEVLLKMMRAEGEEPDRIAVMEGSLSEFDLGAVLQVISLGRQLTNVEVFDRNGAIVGKLEMKAGRLVSATSGPLVGLDALARVIRTPRDGRFAVYRSRREVGEQNLGSLAHIMAKLGEIDDQWEGSESNTQSRDGVAKTVQESRAETGGVMLDEHAPRSARSFFPPQAAKRGAAPAREVPVICVTSPKGGSGKTTVTLNLGVALARQGKRVVLVDTDYNGMLLALNAQGRTGGGAFDVLAGKARLSDVAIQTRIPGLRILPSGEPTSATGPSTAAWKYLYDEARAQADIILVDTSAGVHGWTAAVCAAASQALVVVPAEPAALRALPLHLQRLESLGSTPPAIVGIVLNFLDFRAGVSLDVLKQLCSGPSAALVFDVPIARSAAFMEAVARGVPLCRGERADTPTIGWVFEMLASSIQDRLGMTHPLLEDAPLL
ncbi:MAG: DUF4388 domain-containing protein [Myxococcota bacterium]|nr:DUF4388 domain-containing protein [Myxococcota bacterium]